MSASVLIADDDPNILRALSFLMEREGHQVRTAADGQQALAAIAETPPDLVLLDLMMPKGNGYDVCRTLRVDRSYDDVRIVMLTAKGCEADQRVGMDLGADAYITKPFAIADVCDAWRRFSAAGSRGPPHRAACRVPTPCDRGPSRQRRRCCAGRRGGTGWSGCSPPASCFSIPRSSVSWAARSSPGRRSISTSSSYGRLSSPASP